MRGDARLRAACGLLLMSLASITQAGPVDRASRFQALRLGNDQQSAEVSESQIGVFPQNMTVTGNETMSCTVGDNEYTIGETFAGNSLCERCSCAHTGVICSQVQCEVRAGCKALHKADLCCPQYQCECERNGKLYSNGEKLVDPKNPCQVCYCQGGEIVCNKIACFRRDDCQPRYVSDRCCPEYDHCPPRDMEMENHIHSKDSTVKPVNGKFEAVSEYTEGYKVTTDNAVVKSGDSLTSENSPEEVGGLLRNGDYLPNIDRSTLPLNINEEAIAKKVLIKTEQSQTINIKEVTQDKSLNNEIRIKEVLPVSSFEISSYSTKSPTIPREVSYNDELSKESEESGEKLYKAEKNEQSHDITSNNEAFPTPPILRIGDQLLFLKLGDLVPENGTLSTPSSVFTVIGAEGLQRVEDDSEEMFEHKEDAKKTDSPNGLLITVIKDDSNMTKEEMSQTEKQLNEAFLNLTENDNNLRTIILSEDVNETTTENPDKILQEVIFQLYATTTVTPQTDDSDSKSEEEKDDLLFNTINQTKVSERFSDSTEITYKENDQTTDDPSVFADKSNSEQPLDDEQQPIPIEHLPEHNPEYPPILEDIMVLPMTEDSLESEFSGGSAIDSHELKFEEKPTPVKRPASFDSAIENRNNYVQKNFNPVKTLPDIQELVRTNETKNMDTAIPLVPEEWLKSTEGSRPKHVELSSPLLALSSAIPDIILQTELKDSSEEDETKIYIFVNNDTLNSNSNIVNLSQPEEITTDETNIQTTESIELEAEYRSPGEPHLVPEWERNLTTTEIPEDSSENFETEQTEDPLFILTTFVENSNGAERVKDKSVIPIEMNTTPNDEHSSNEITPFLEYSTEYVKPSRESMYRSSSPFVESQMENQKESSLERSREAITHPVTTTEHSIQTVDVTDNKAIFHSDTEVVQNFDLFDIGAHTKKQKKTSSLLAAEMKNDNSNDLTKKGNILADLINLVGDVAAMGTHDIEISTVSNRIDVPKLAESPMKEDKIKIQQIITQKPLSTTAKIVTTPGIVEEYVTAEFSEFTPSNDKIDVETPSENDKVEMTTKKTYIDKDGDDRNSWKSTDYIVKDIEIIPKVGNNLIKKNNSHERIFTNDDTVNDIASTTEYKNVATSSPVTTTTPRNLIVKEKIQKVLADGRKNIVTETKIQFKTDDIDISAVTHMPSIPEVEEKAVFAKEVLMKNDAIDLSISPLKNEVTTLKPTTRELNLPNVDSVEKAEIDKVIENNAVKFTELNEMVTKAQMTTKSPFPIQTKEDKRTNVYGSSKESFKNVVNNVVNKVPITTLLPISNEKYGSDTNINTDTKSNTQLRQIITNLMETTKAPSVSREKIMTDTTNEKTNMQFKKFVTNAPLTAEETQNPINKDTPKVNGINKKEDVIIYTTVKTSTSTPTTIGTKILTEAIKQISQDIPAESDAVVKNETVVSENLQRLDAERAATESPGVTSTVMKVSSRTQNDDSSQENASTENGRDKLTKRETNSQLTDASGQINESLISIMRDFFEKQYRH